MVQSKTVLRNSDFLDDLDTRMVTTTYTLSDLLGLLINFEDPGMDITDNLLQCLIFNLLVEADGRIAEYLIYPSASLLDLAHDAILEFYDGGLPPLIIMSNGQLLLGEQLL